MINIDKEWAERLAYETWACRGMAPAVAHGINLKNSDGTYQVPSIEREFKVWQAARAALVPVEPPQLPKPSAWRHKLDNTDGIKGNKPSIVLSCYKQNPFGKPGIDYSESYPVTSEPLYTQDQLRGALVAPMADGGADARDAGSRKINDWLALTIRNTALAEAAELFHQQFVQYDGEAIQAMIRAQIYQYATLNLLPTLSNSEIDRVTSGFKQADHHDSIRACIAAVFAAPAPESRVEAPSAGSDEPTERESLIACLEDDAAKLADANPDDEMAQTMRDAARLLELDGGAPSAGSVGDDPMDLCELGKRFLAAAEDGTTCTLSSESCRKLLEAMTTPPANPPKLEDAKFIAEAAKAGVFCTMPQAVALGRAIEQAIAGQSGKDGAA